MISLHAVVLPHLYILYSQHMCSYIIWNPNEVFFQLGFLTVRWYSLMIIAAFVCGRQFVKYFFKKEGRPEVDVDELSLYVLIACLIGARLGEVFFYSFSYYRQHPLEAIFPVEFSPTFRIVGYQGLSYHGALVGGIIGTLLYAYYKIQLSLIPLKLSIKKCRKHNQSFLWLLTPVAFGVLMGLFVRIGNFINSEIIGTPTHNKYGVLFASAIVKAIQNTSPCIQRVEVMKDKAATPHSEDHYQPIVIKCIFPAGVEKAQIAHFVNNKIESSLRYGRGIRQHLYLPTDAPLDYVINKHAYGQYKAHIKAFGIPRHPVQLYESFAYILILGMLIAWWRWKGSHLRNGMLAGMAMILSYTARFFLEFVKDAFHVVIPGTMPITMGHILSFCTVLGGVFLVAVSYCFDRDGETHAINCF